MEIIRYYSLPLRLSSVRGKGGGPVLEVLPQPFVHAAYAQQPHETKHTFAQRLFAQLTTMVSALAPPLLLLPPLRACLSAHGGLASRDLALPSPVASSVNAHTHTQPSL